MASEGEGGWLEVDFEGFGRDIGGSNCEEDVVAFFIMLGGALGPDDCKDEFVSRLLEQTNEMDDFK